ncbi:hypothetical protein LCGC14_2566980 [marine sediment metagenome]|uniref:Archaeal Type IV pilin N-terminal domain-containing protein n=1 Tax=marine sediment metagenome TaxID=412755 RepID=A0A0F9B6C1_9ZZZZ
MIMKKKSGKGISPVIATVLLVAMVLVIGLIIFLWFRGITQEAVTKFGGTNIELVCNDVGFSSSYSSGILSLSNTGNVPIFGMKLKVSSQGSHKTHDLRDISGNWPSIGLRQGGTFSSGDLSSTISGASEALVIPVLIGSSERGEQSHVCDEQYGQELVL